MDIIIPNFIKINQTTIPEAGSQKLSNQLESSGKSFNQILAMFKQIGQITPQIEGEKSTFSHNDQMNSIDLNNLKEEDLWELESILNQFLAEIKLIQYYTGSNEEAIVPKGNESQLSIKLTEAYSIQQQFSTDLADSIKLIGTDITKQLAQWFQKVEGTKKPISNESVTIMQKLDNLVTQLQSKENQNLFDIETDLVEKIQNTINEIKFESNQATNPLQENIRLSKVQKIPFDFKDKPLKFEDDIEIKPESLQSLKVEELLQYKLEPGKSIKAEDLFQFNKLDTRISSMLGITLQLKPDKTLPNNHENRDLLIPENTMEQPELEVNLNLNRPENSVITPGLIQKDSEPMLQTETISFSKNPDEITKMQPIYAPTTHTMVDDEVEITAPQNTKQLTLSNFVPEVSSFAGRYVRILNNLSGSTEAKFNLFPEHLGHLEVKIVSQEGQVSVQIVTDSSIAKESLEGQLHQLRQSLITQGFQVQKLEITQQLPATLDSSPANLSFSQGGSSSSHEQASYFLERENSKKQSNNIETEVERELVSITYGGSTAKASSRIDFTA